MPGKVFFWLSTTWALTVFVVLKAMVTCDGRSERIRLTSGPSEMAGCTI